MYTPFLRGRKFDLEAIDDLAFKASNYANGKLVPVIEPVSFKAECLKRYFNLVKKQIPFCLIYNPISVDFTPDQVEANLINGTLDGYEGYYITFLISQLTTLRQVEAFISRFNNKKTSFLHYSTSGESDKIIAYLNGINTIHHHFFLTNSLTKRYIDSVKSPGAKRITIIDFFNKLETNASYATNETEYFSDLHKTYLQSGFDGFGDFSIMGERFEEGKGIARAVVIHWHYIDSEDGSVWIKHFVSNNTKGTEDIAGKFGEAYSKLAAFHKRDPVKVNSLGHYFISQKGDKGEPMQLGAIKKYSIMHHLELIRTLINN